MRLGLMSDEFRFTRSGRQPRSLIFTGLAVAALLHAVLALQIHPVIAAIFGALLLPAIWDIAKDTRSEITVTDSALSWRMGGRGETFELHEIQRVKTRLSLDFSQKAQVLTKDGKSHRIPPPCVPPDGSLDDALKERDVEVERTLF